MLLPPSLAVRFEPNCDITGMISVEGELIPLKTKIKPNEANGAVEKWLVQVSTWLPGHGSAFCWLAGWLAHQRGSLQCHGQQ